MADLNLETVAKALHDLLDEVIKTHDFEESAVMTSLGGSPGPLVRAYLAGCDALGIGEEGG